MSEIVSQFPSLFSGSESEDNWQSRDRAMAALTEALSTSADAGEVVGLNLKIVLDSVLKSTASLRTTLVMTACACVAAIAAHVAPSTLEPQLDNMKLVASAGATATMAIIQHAPFHIKTLQSFITTAGDKNAQVRSHGIKFTLAATTHIVIEEGRGEWFARVGGLECVASCLKKALSDASPEVRETSRQLFDLYNEHWPARGEALLNELEPATRKAVLKSVAKKPGQPPKVTKSSSVTSNPQPKPALIETNHGVLPLPSSKVTPRKAPVEITSSSPHAAAVSPLPASTASSSQKLMNDLNSELESKKELISSATLIQTLKAILVGDHTISIPNLQLSPTGQTLLDSYITESDALEAFLFLTQALSFNSTRAFPAMKQRRSPTTTSTNSSISATSAVTSLLITLTRMLGLKSTTRACREDVYGILKWLWRVCPSVLKRVLETVDLDVAAEVHVDDVISLQKATGELEPDRAVVKSPLTVMPVSVDDSSSSMSDFAVDGGDEGLDTQLNLADITFEGGLVEESLLVDETKSENMKEENIYDQDDFEECQPQMHQDTPKAVKSFLINPAIEMSAFPGGMIGVPPANEVKPSLIQLDTKPTSPARATPKTTANAEFLKWWTRFQNGEYTNNVLETLYCMANPHGGVSGRLVIDNDHLGNDTKEALFLILSVLFMRSDVCNRVKDIIVVEQLVSGRSDARFQVAGGADTALMKFMEMRDPRFCLESLCDVLERQAFVDWKEASDADDFQPHPLSTVFEYLGKTVARMAAEVASDLDVDRVMMLCSKEMGSTRVDVRRSAIMCLVDVFRAMEGGGARGSGEFWGKVGGLLSPSQVHLLTNYITSG
ncbi:hypothetical protein BCR33DRAFT_719753 [Rhizoclosmatium globosum]|uniref:TOG domain-containing protein n=1 Tax=Rhizoclosmatium globosum TaxID=329046 RepID=A0A1Y2BYV1_9FUNG|nr:hypothetical protein BCR33DRAFT_719753 [Rhizoclosmatium globosum]|eukprot:ORY39948.1 hypothetical protein BCR33DRAFT_719753 [Rhizoclosmatium globosum]